VSATVSIEGSTPVTGNDPGLLSKMMPTLEWAAGEEKVVEHPLITGAEDYSFFQARIPGLFLMLGVNDPGVPAGASPSNHSPMFSPNEDAMMTGVRALVGFAMDYKAANP
jgi:amidohydrolase